MKQIKKIIYLLTFIIPCFLVSSFSPKFKPTFSLRTVVIDAGHGGKDPGCHGKNTNEKDVTLAVAIQLGKYIEENIKDVKVVYTRKTDVFVELQERATIANKAKADLFISIHCNSACYRDKKLKKDICKDFIYGAETYVMGIKNEQGKLDVAKRENSAILLEENYVQKYDGFDPNSDESYIIMSMFTDTYLNQSLNFASKLQTQYSTKGGRKDKGVKRQSLWVLWRTFMPSVLTEIGYLTNPEEEKILGSIQGQEYIASCIFRAFRSYKDEIDGTIKKYDDAFENQKPLKPIVDSTEIDDEKAIIVAKMDTVVKENEIKVKPKEKVNEKPKEPLVEKPKEKSEDKKVIDKPVEKINEKPKEVLVEMPTEKSIEKTIEKPIEKVNEKSKEQVVEAPIEKVTEKPIEKPIEKINEKPKDSVTVETPIEKFIEKPVEKPIEKVNEKSKEQVVETPIEKVTEKPIEKPIEKINEKPKDAVILETPIEKFIEKRVEKPIEKVNDKPKEVIVQTPIEKAIEKPVEKPIEKPVEKINEKPKEVVVEKSSSPLIYKVQILMSEKRLDLKSDKFKGLEKPGEYIDKGIYKYTVGEYENRKDAEALQIEMRTKNFKDAFIIKMQDGKRILSK